MAARRLGADFDLAVLLILTETATEPRACGALFGTAPHLAFVGIIEPKGIRPLAPLEPNGIHQVWIQEAGEKK